MIRSGMFVGKFEFKLLKVTDLDVARGLLHPPEVSLKSE